MSGAASGWAIFTAALGLLVRRFGTALRISVVPFAVVAVVYGLLLASAGVPVGGPMQTDGTVVTPALDGRGLLAGSALAVAYVLALLWVAVAWHRAALLDEAVGVVPPFNGRAMWGYAWRTAVIALVLIVAALVMGIPAGLLAAGIGQAVGGTTGAIVGGLLAALAVNAVLGALFYSIALILPACAVNRPIGIGDSSAAASGRFGALLVLALLTAAITLLLDLPATLDAALGTGLGPWIGFALTLAAQWFVLMLGLSVLTTLYAHLIEGRPV